MTSEEIRKGALNRAGQYLIEIIPLAIVAVLNRLGVVSNIWLVPLALGTLVWIAFVIGSRRQLGRDSTGEQPKQLFISETERYRPVPRWKVALRRKMEWAGRHRWAVTWPVAALLLALALRFTVLKAVPADAVFSIGVTRLLDSAEGDSLGVTDAVLAELRARAAGDPTLEIIELDEGYFPPDSVSYRDVRSRTPGLDLVVTGWYQTRTPAILRFTMLHDRETEKLDEDDALRKMVLTEFSPWNEPLEYPESANAGRAIPADAAMFARMLIGMRGAYGSNTQKQARKDEDGVSVLDLSPHASASPDVLARLRSLRGIDLYYDDKYSDAYILLELEGSDTDEAGSLNRMVRYLTNDALGYHNRARAILEEVAQTDGPLREIAAAVLSALRLSRLASLSAAEFAAAEDDLEHHLRALEEKDESLWGEWAADMRWRIRFLRASAAVIDSDPASARANLDSIDETSLDGESKYSVLQCRFLIWLTEVGLRDASLYDADDANRYAQTLEQFCATDRNPVGYDRLRVVFLPSVAKWHDAHMPTFNAAVERLLASDPSADALIDTAEALDMLGRNEEAIAVMDRALELLESEDLLEARVQRLRLVGEMDPAQRRRELQAMLVEEPHHALLHYELCDAERTLSSVIRMVRSGSDWSWPYYILSVHARREGDHQKAIEFCSSGMEWSEEDDLFETLMSVRSDDGLEIALDDDARKHLEYGSILDSGCEETWGRSDATTVVLLAERAANRFLAGDAAGAVADAREVYASLDRPLCIVAHLERWLPKEDFKAPTEALLFLWQQAPELATLVHILWERHEWDTMDALLESRTTALQEDAQHKLADACAIVLVADTYNLDTLTAIYRLERLVEQGLRHDFVFNRLGELYASAELWPEAARYFEAAIRIDTNGRYLADLRTVLKEIQDPSVERALRHLPWGSDGGRTLPNPIRSSFQSTRPKELEWLSVRRSKPSRGEADEDYDAVKRRFVVGMRERFDWVPQALSETR